MEWDKRYCGHAGRIYTLQEEREDEIFSFLRYIVGTFYRVIHILFCVPIELWNSNLTRVGTIFFLKRYQGLFSVSFLRCKLDGLTILKLSVHLKCHIVIFSQNELSLKDQVKLRMTMEVEVGQVNRYFFCLVYSISIFKK